MAQMAQIVVEYCGDQNTPLASMFEDAERAKVILVRDDGVFEVLFTGAHFSPEEFARRLAPNQARSKGA